MVSLSIFLFCFVVEVVPLDSSGLTGEMVGAGFELWRSELRGDQSDERSENVDWAGACI